VKIIICDPMPSEAGHSLGFNTAILKLADEAFSKGIDFIASDSVISNIGNKYSFNDVTFSGSLEPYDPDSNSSFGLRRVAISNYWKAVQAAKRYDSLLLFTQAGTLSFGMFATIISKRLLKMVALISHNNIQDAQESSIKRWGFRKIVDSIGKLLVFEELFIKDVEGLMGKPVNNIGVMNNPQHLHMMNTLTPEEIPASDDEKMKISFVGSFREEKGVEILPKVVELLTKKVPTQEKLRLCLYGDMHKNLKGELPQSSFVKIKDTYLSEEEYKQTILKSDYIITPHLKSFYPRVSGVFLDAVAMKTPVISSDNPVFSRYFDEYGALGIQFKSNDPSSLADAIIKVLNITSKRYKQFQSNIDGYLNDRNKVKLAEQLKENLKVLR